MKIAQFKSLEHGYTTLEAIDWFGNNPGNGYVRLTEFVEIELVNLPAKETVPVEVAALEKAKEKAHEQYLGLAATIDDRISKLLAIEDQSHESN